MKTTAKAALTSVLFLLPLAAFAATPPAPGQTHTMLDTYKEGGPVMHFLLVFSVVMVWLVIDIWIKTSRKNMTPPTDTSTAQELFRSGDYVGAYQAMKAGVSPYCEVVRSALGSVGYGKEATEEALFATVDKINSTLQTRINYLSVIGVCAPMVGLLGTVAGMKGAFGALGTSGADVGALAGHIGEVLVATASGLFVAIPAFGFFYFLRNRLQGAVFHLQDEAEHLFRNTPYEYLQSTDVGQEETYAALPNWVEAPEAEA
ncbi:MAG: MotA/TolQ/ExbB proton channel family protein [Luteolibacter sp.]